MRVVATSSLPIDLRAQVVRAFPDARVDVPPDGAGHVGLPADLGAVDALICLLRDRIDDAVLARAPRLRIVANVAVGVDNVDLDACARRGVAVANTPDVLTEATAEFAFLLALAVARRLGEGERLVRAGAWTGWALDQLCGVSLVGRTLGIIGLGRIGRALARRAAGFGMRVIDADTRPGRGAVALDELLATADVVSLHCPLVPATRHLLDAARIARMKPGAILVNTARGAIVDDDALVAALRAGHLRGAGLDVYVDEPRIDPRYLAADLADRVVLAPHIGSATTETRTQMAQLCADAVIAVLSGRTPANLVVRRG